MPRRIPGRLMPHGGLVTFRRILGTGPTGPVHAADVVTPPRANIQERRRLIRTPDGREVMSSATVWLDPEYPVPEGSLMRVWVGREVERECTVVGVALMDHPGLPVHVELALE